MSAGPATRRRLGALLAVVAAFVVGALAPSPAAAAPAAPVAPAAASCGPAPEGRTAVAVVIDTGRAAPSVHCVEVVPGATGGEALLAAVGQAGVRRDVTGPKGPAFVCGILGVPAEPECAAVGEPYWSYWGGGPGGWTYRSVGAFTGSRISGRCAVEGWRFGTDRNPPAVAVPAVRCEAAPQQPPPTAAPAPPGTAAPLPAAGPAPAPRAAGGGAAVAGGPAPTVAGATADAPVQNQPGATGDSAAAPEPGDPTAAADGAAASEAVPEHAAAGTGASGAGGGGDGRGDVRTRAVALAADAGSGDAGGAGGPGAGALVAVALVAGLGAAAVVRNRRRDAPPPA